MKIGEKGRFDYRKRGARTPISGDLQAPRGIFRILYFLIARSRQRFSVARRHTRLSETETLLHEAEFRLQLSLSPRQFSLALAFSSTVTEPLPALWHLELLGEMRLARPDAPPGAPSLRFRSRKTAALLALLALRRGPHRREALAEMLWPETDPLKARSSLRVALSSLRTLLETPDAPPGSAAPDAVLQISRDSVALGAALTSDVEGFHRDLALAFGAPEAGLSPVKTRIEGLKTALQWYRGPLFIADEADELAGEAARLEDEYVDALLELLAALRAQDRGQEALEIARRGLERAPLREEIALETLSLSLDLGRFEATRDFKNWCARAEKQGVSVAASTLKRARELETSARQNSSDQNSLHRNSPGHPQSRRANSGRPNPPQLDLSRPNPPVFGPPNSDSPNAPRPRNASARGLVRDPGLSPGLTAILPPVWTKFFGREAEISAHAELLRRGARLLTLIGAGGAGKTALALQIARRLAAGSGLAAGSEAPNLAFKELDFALDAGDFGLMVWVSLAELPVAARIPAALAQALGAATSGDLGSPSAPIAALQAAKTRCGARRDARILLILDGFEHLCDDGGPLVRQWLDALPELTCLLPSRRALGFAGEVRREVRPLDTAVGPTSESRESAATALFLDRAQLARPAWSPSGEEIQTMEAIIARLGGLPLALEIAAARLSLLSPAQILAAIEASTASNSGNATEVASPLSWKNPDRAAPARQATLRASIAWSERQLPLAAARFWRQISVFRGGFTLDAATQICEMDAAPLVMALVETSLLRLDTSGPAPRAMQLEIERHYAASLLTEAETAALEERHARYFASWSESHPGSAALGVERWNVERAQIWLSRQDNASD